MLQRRRGPVVRVGAIMAATELTVMLGRLLVTGT
jgi:hypothetical protein